MDIKAIIFDYGRTLFDRENNKFFPETPEILNYLSKKYKLAIVSITTDRSPPKERIKKLEEAGIINYFYPILFDPLNKDHLFQEALLKLNITPSELAIVDDRMFRGIKWGNKNGAMTVWLRAGKFSNETPNDETGKPSHTIINLLSLKNLL